MHAHGLGLLIARVLAMLHAFAFWKVRRHRHNVVGQTQLGGCTRHFASYSNFGQLPSYKYLLCKISASCLIFFFCSQILTRPGLHGCYLRSPSGSIFNRSPNHSTTEMRPNSNPNPTSLRRPNGSSALANNSHIFPCFLSQQIEP